MQLTSQNASLPNLSAVGKIRSVFHSLVHILLAHCLEREYSPIKTQLLCVVEIMVSVSYQSNYMCWALTLLE